MCYEARDRGHSTPMAEGRCGAGVGLVQRIYNYVHKHGRGKTVVMASGVRTSAGTLGPQACVFSHNHISLLCVRHILHWKPHLPFMGVLCGLVDTIG